MIYDKMKFACTLVALFLFGGLFRCCEKPEPVLPAEEQEQETDVPGKEKEETPEPDRDSIPSAAVPDAVSFADLLDELVSYDDITRYPTIPYVQRQASSYDRRSKDPSTPEWFANDDGWGYERYEFARGVTEKVIFDETAPGVITRMWFTSFGSPQTVIRFYFDGAQEPSWVVNSFNLKDFADYAGAKLGDALAQPSATWIRGSSMYLPIPYSRSCKITIEELVEPITVSRYYHINYRRYPDSFKVETLTPQLFKDNVKKIISVNSSLLKPDSGGGKGPSLEAMLQPGDSVCVDLPQGPYALNSLALTASCEDSGVLAEALEDLETEAFFDGYKTVSLPFLYLAGTGRGARYNKCWRFENDSKGSFVLRWKMPYRKTGRILLRNSSYRPIRISLSTMCGKYKWDTSSMYFHAASKTEKSFPIRYWSDYANGIEWNFATIEGGRGLYVGDMYSINNSTHEWPGEGDEKIWVDDESFPSHFGTGVEDYYSFCGYFRFNTPFSGEPRLDNNDFYGWNTHYRIRILDAIPFSDRLRFQLEMEGHGAGTADLENAVFWYGDPSTHTNK